MPSAKACGSTGFAGLPTLSRANSLGQYLFVNGRPVRDKLLVGAVRAAYADYLPRDRHPVLALFVSLDPREVDVNVHPAKTEVRFRDGALVRGLIVRALKEALVREGQRAATTGGSATIATFRPAARAAAGRYDWRRSPARPSGLRARCAAAAAGLRGSRAGRLRCRRAGRGCGDCELRARRRPDRPPARRRARPAARDLYRRADPRRPRDRRPACRARAHRLRAHEGRARKIRRGTADPADPGNRRARRSRRRAACRARRRTCPVRPGDRAVRPRRGRGPRDAVDARRGRCQGIGRRSRRAHGRMGRHCRWSGGSCMFRRPWPATARCAPGAG